jgi:hypothetical protein
VFRESCTVTSPKLEREKGDFREQKKYIYRVGWRDVPLDLFCLFFPSKFYDNKASRERILKTYALS